MNLSPSGTMLVCQAANKTIELFNIYQGSDITRRKNRRIKRAKKKNLKIDFSSSSSIFTKLKTSTTWAKSEIAEVRIKTIE